MVIESILIKEEACFDEIGQNISDLKRINYFYGPNGSGKTTISRVIGEEDKYASCNVSWKAGSKLQALVYNRDFVNRNFSSDKELKGVFTLGEQEAGIITAIETAKIELESIAEKIKGKNIALKGEDGKGGKKFELKDLEIKFSDQCWKFKQKYDDEFKVAFSGVRDKKENFKSRLLKETKDNNASLLSYEELKDKAQTVFAENLFKENIIPQIQCSELTDLENAPILAKKVIGKDDVDITAMIKALANSDWVKQGSAYYEKNNGYCPFCQQKTEAKFAKNLEEYFDDAYLQDINAIDTLTTNYKTYSDSVLARLEGILTAKPAYLDCEKIQIQKDAIATRITANKGHIGRKKKESSAVIALESLKETLNEIGAAITAANEKAKEHNATIDNLTTAKRDLTNQIWRFVVSETELIYEPYWTKKKDLIMAISALDTRIKSLEADYKNKSEYIQNLEKKITSIKPTVDEINKLLLSFGFSNFILAESDKDGFYKILRPNGEDAKETLSEGEKTFITFLYFYHLLKGSNTESGITENRIVVFDDPVSSLDSDILFIVSNLIKGVFDEARSETGQIKQVFVLTHNIYFHKEISFVKNRSGDNALKDETFWVIKKHSKYSIIEHHKTNPIKTSYELLWNEIRDSNRSSLTIQNVMRRILENYFKILGGIDNDEIVNNFDGKEKVICSSLMSWINIGSHFANDDLYVTCDDQTVEKYLEVFRSIFEKSGHRGHYNMMMRISEDSLQPEDLADDIQLLETET